MRKIEKRKIKESDMDNNSFSILW